LVMATIFSTSIEHEATDGSFQISCGPHCGFLAGKSQTGQEGPDGPGLGRPALELAHTLTNEFSGRRSAVSGPLIVPHPVSRQTRGP